MKYVLLGMCSLLFFWQSASAANVQLNIDGVAYSCQATNGGGGGGGSTNPGVNLCRCKEKQYSATDYDYILEKYSRATQAFTTLESYSSSDSEKGAQDRANCEAG